VHLALEEVDGRYLEPRELAPAEAQVAAGQDHGAIAVGNLIGQAVELVRREGTHLMAQHLGERDADAGRLADDTFHHGSTQDRGQRVVDLPHAGRGLACSNERGDHRLDLGRPDG
jgi:hypothetical protein